MLVSARVVVLVFGIVVLALSVWGMYAPRRLVAFVKGVMHRNFGIYVAISVRIVLGLALIIAAGVSRFPALFQLFGWITILAAALLAIMGRAGMRRVVTWFDRFPPVVIRLWLVFGLAFSGLLIVGAS